MAAARTAVEKTSIDENGNALLFHYEIGLP
jgi:hypothetical protein